MILGVLVAVFVGGAEECRGALVVAVEHGDGGESSEAFERHGPDDHLVAERQLLAERM